MATRDRRAWRVAASCAVCVFTAAFVATVPGSATAKPRPSLHDVQAKVDQLHREAGKATERYDDARVQFVEANRRLTVVRHRLEAQRAAVAAMQSSVGQLASAAYKSGGVDPTVQILLAKNPKSFLQSAVALNQLGRQQAATLARVIAARQSLAAARNDVVQQRARASAIADEIRAEKKSVTGKLAAARQLLGTLQADQLARYNAARTAAADRGRAVASRARSGDLPKYDGPASGRAAEAIKTAYAQLGDPYAYGAAGPNAFDCSGLTMYSWRSAGVSLPHSSSAQYASTRHVAISDLRPGDLVFYYSPISHVGIYIGGGRIIHAPHPGLSVEIAGLHMMPLVGAARP